MLTYGYGFRLTRQTPCTGLRIRRPASSSLLQKYSLRVGLFKLEPQARNLR